VARRDPGGLRDSRACGSGSAAFERRIFSFKLPDSSLEGSYVGYGRIAVLFDGKTHLPHLLQNFLEVDGSCGGHDDDSMCSA
jgi:hypothetical protein